jgi:hypothetical protein
MTSSDLEDEMTATQRIDKHITELSDWRGDMIARLRKLVLEAAPEVNEEWKWGSPVWAHKGNVLSAGVFKDHVKLNFFKGASLQDMNGLFNAGLESKATRGIDLHEGDQLNEVAIKELVRAAVNYNLSGNKKK